MKIKYSCILAVLLASCLLLTACNDTSQPIDQQPGITSSSSSSQSVSASVSSDTSQPVISEDDNETVPSPETVDTSDISDMLSSEDDDSSETSSVQSQDVSSEEIMSGEPDESEEPDVTSSSSTTVTTPPVTTTIPPTSVSTTSPEPPVAVQIVIPDVKTVSAPGKAIADSGTAVIDYSNAKLGYIAACYSGSSARAKLRIQCGGVTNDHDLAADGTTEYFPLFGSGDYSIGIYEQIEGKSYGVAADAQFSVSISDDVEMYLYPNKYVSFDKKADSVYKAAEVTAGMDTTIEKLAAIFGYITDNITYDYDLASTVKSGYIPDPDNVLKKRSGICFDYASLFAAMARSQGIPTRLVIGYASPDIYHAWNEVYTKETGWISAELLLDIKGYNLVDATFYAGASDKAAMADYISDDANYSAVYRY
ncbi:MAG: transglutaminase domain-containing protein [Oscillospiraceae bacterium]|nr:transglutaminase domain-containing protein [Oscillospiraceae bacterium]